MLPETVLERFLSTFVLAFAFGLARQKLGKAIGFGTFIFVALGACGLSLVALEFADQQQNPLPLLSAIVTGIGFLGAGALFRTADRVVGFTSAATIWIFACFGMAIGLGEFLIGSMLYVAVWSVVVVDFYFEQKRIGAHARKLRLDLCVSAGDDDLAQLGLPRLVAAESIAVDRDEETLSVVYALRQPRQPLERLTTELTSHPLVKSFRIE